MNRLISGLPQDPFTLKDGILIGHGEGGKAELNPGVGGAGFYELRLLIPGMGIPPFRGVRFSYVHTDQKPNGKEKGDGDHEQEEHEKSPQGERRIRI